MLINKIFSHSWYDQRWSGVWCASVSRAGPAVLCAQRTMCGGSVLLLQRIWPVRRRSRRTRQLQSVSMYHGQFLTPTESTPFDRSPKNLLLVITSATANGCAKFVEKSVHGGLLGKWVKYDIFKIYLYLFFMNVRPVDGFLRLMAQTTQGCAFLGICWYWCLFWGWNAPKTPILGVWIGVFKPNGQNIESFMLSKLHHRF